MNELIEKNGELKIITLDSGKEFGNSICHHMNSIYKNKKIKKVTKLIKIDEIHFSNGEIKVVIKESIRGGDVYIVQLFDQPLKNITNDYHSKNFNSINDNIFAIATAIQATYYSDVNRITAVIPQFPYARQDKRKEREPITAKLIGNFLESCGTNRVITLDIHSENIQGFFDKMMMENLHMGRILINYIKTNTSLDNLMVVAPDIGSAQRNVFFAQKLKCKLAIIHKTRDYSKISNISTMTLVGNVSGKDILICDDMIATGGTIIGACKLLKKNGARNIIIAVALPFFSLGVEKFQKAYDEKLFTKVIGTNAVAWSTILKDKPWYHELDVSQLFAQVIYNLNQNQSVSQLLN
jgi:ribose-phosphate pyrophosphokinase